MLKRIILLLTYKCTLECDHCYLYCGPKAKGTMTLVQIREVLEEAVKVGTIEMISFQGGEAFLFYPLMLEGMKITHEMGFNIWTVTNGYWATTVEDAMIWLKPLCELGVRLGVSDDSFHFGDQPDSPAKTAITAAKQLNMSVLSSTIEEPRVDIETGQAQTGMTLEAEDNRLRYIAVLRGRAVEKLSKGLPRRSWQEFTECPYTSHAGLESPMTIYIDAYGTVQPFCQGLSLGNIWEVPLSRLIKDYDAASHPICGPLVRGGPVLLAEEYGVEHEDTYVSACHMCYLVRRALIDRFPQYLTPRQVYGF
jgi:organic radical activating enzyme